MFSSYLFNRSIKAGLVAVGLSALVASPAQAGPYSGGYVGTAYNSTAVAEWAHVVDSYNPGPDQIGSDPTTPAFNDTTQALGQANAINTQNSGDVVSLGDGGSIILSFASPIVNGTGSDFSVFENGFESYPGSGIGFLELATVSVSSDGINYFTFPSVSLTPTTSQVGSFGNLDPTNLYDLAGKTFAGTGADFDLQELAGISPLLLNLNNIQYVKITDVVGEDSAPYGTKDSLGNYINDPFPTDFPSSGFDLDAIAVLNDKANASPEPTTWLLLIVSLLTLLSFRRLRQFALTAAALVAVPALSFAGTPVDFSSLTPTTAYTGTGGGDYTNNTAFTLDGGALSFNNYYDTTYGDWAGFAYSNTHDETTPDYTNQYSAEVPGFATASSVPPYAVAYVSDGFVYPTITFQAGEQPTALSVTNTVYTYQAIKNGSSFSQPFSPGSFFTLVITGYNAQNITTGSVDFSLANYPVGGTLSEVGNWTNVDLSSLGAGTDELVFSELSSDVGELGINTPEYFALDSVTITATPEPSVTMLLLAGVLGLAFLPRRART